MRMLGNVRNFTLNMDMKVPNGATLLERNVMTLRLVYMLEELAEFGQAHRANDIPKAADALVDLVYFALGTAMQMGLPWEALWDVVHRANMAKRPGLDKYGAQGVIKPADWVSPHETIEKIIRESITRGGAA